MGARGPKRNTPYMPTDESRRAAFLKALRESGGSFAAACRATAPHLEDTAANPPGYSTWRALIQRDPAFAAAVEETLQIVRDDIESEMHRRSVVGVDQGVYQKAQRVYEPVIGQDGQPVLNDDGNPLMQAASIRRYSDALLIKRAAALMPDKYGEKKTVDVNYNVQRSGAWEIMAMDLDALTADEQDQLASIMAKVRDHRRGISAIENTPAIETEFSEVE